MSDIQVVESHGAHLILSNTGDGEFLCFFEDGTVSMNVWSPEQRRFVLLPGQLGNMQAVWPAMLWWLRSDTPRLPAWVDWVLENWPDAMDMSTLLEEIKQGLAARVAEDRRLMAQLNDRVTWVQSITEVKLSMLPVIRMALGKGQEK